MRGGAAASRSCPACLPFFALYAIIKWCETSSNSRLVRSVADRGDAGRNPFEFERIRDTGLGNCKFFFSRNRSDALPQNFSLPPSVSLSLYLSINIGDLFHPQALSLSFSFSFSLFLQGELWCKEHITVYSYIIHVTPIGSFSVYTY